MGGRGAGMAARLVLGLLVLVALFGVSSAARSSPPQLYELCSQVLQAWKTRSVDNIAHLLGTLSEQVGPDTPVGSQASQLRYWMAGQANEPRIFAALDPFLVAEILVHAS